MDFHVWAKLDADGRIQSVQSSCTHSPQGNSPMRPYVPFGSPEQRYDGPFQTNMDNSEKVVPYMEKKELVYKLDAKVDEMSVIMTQLAELTKRVKVQEKLIAQYEEKLTVKEKQLKSLRRENEKLRNERHWVRKTSLPTSCSESSLTAPACTGHSNLDFRMICNLEQSHRASSWPCDRKIHEGYFDERKKEAESQKICDDIEDFDDVDGASPLRPCADVIKGAERPSSLKLGFDIYGSLAGSGVDLQGHFNIHGDSTIKNGYSYVKKQGQLVLQSTDSRHEVSPENEIKEELPENSEKKRLEHPLGNVCNDGYLDMNHSKCVCSNNDSLYSVSKDMPEENTKQTNEPCGQSSFIENEAIHSTWKDVKNGNLITAKEDDNTCGKIHVLPDGYLEPMGITHGYVDLSITDENVLPSGDKPPVPARRPRSKSRESEISSLDRHWSFSSADSDKSPEHDEYIRRTSLPVASNMMSSRNHPNKGEKHSKFAKMRTAHSFDHPADQKYVLPVPSEERTPGADFRKDDHLNKVFKDMRTTMEWNKAKKKLISKSNDYTVNKVELILRSTVQEIYEAYNKLHAEKGTRLKRYPKEKVLEKIKTKISQSPDDKTASEELMKKCLDLVMSTFPC